MEKGHYWCYKEITNYENMYKTYSDFEFLLKKLKYIVMLDKKDDIGGDITYLPKAERPRMDKWYK